LTCSTMGSSASTKSFKPMPHWKHRTKSARSVSKKA